MYESIIMQAFLSLLLRSVLTRLAVFGNDCWHAIFSSLPLELTFLFKTKIILVRTITCQFNYENKKSLKWYYDQKIISFFSSDFESVFAKHPTGKILSFVLYPTAVYFECKFWISRSAITHVQN